jgi:LCP family protein required for cell wall assembly
MKEGNQQVVKRKIFLSRIKRKLLKHVLILRIILLTIIFSLVFGLGFLGFSAIKKSFLPKLINLGLNFIFIPKNKIEILDNKTNVLILGKGGTGHEGPDLTDTMIFASFSYIYPQITLITIPRDIWVPSIRAKINSAYYYGKLPLAKLTVEEIVGMPIKYAVVIDFSGFTKIIDILGGITVDVEKSFVDNQYPIEGKERDLCDGDPLYRCRYETIFFQKGPQIMDGATALKFVRSRHAKGAEGTDFARSARQERVIRAIKEKLLSKEILLDPTKVIKVAKVVQGSIETDIPEEVEVILARLLFDAKDNIKSYTFPVDLLINPPISSKYDNQYVFIPKDGSWEKFQSWMKSVLP